jgi:hypothetical protein
MLYDYFSVAQLKDFCKKAGLKCSRTKSNMMSTIKNYLKKYKVAPRYIRGLNPVEKWVKMFEIRYNTLKERAGIKKSYRPSILDDKYQHRILPNRKYSIKSYSKEKSRLKQSIRKPIKKQTRKPKKQSKKLSTYTIKWNKEYSGAKSLAAKSKISGVPLDILKKVYNKGLAAWRGGAHRPGATQQSWGVARVNSFLTCGKAFYFPDHLLAKEAMKRSPKAKAFWSKRRCKFNKMGQKTPSR